MKKLILFLVLIFAITSYAQVERAPLWESLTVGNMTPRTQYNINPFGNQLGNLGATGTRWNFIYGDTTITNHLSNTTWTLNSISVTTTGTQINYLAGATGTTGTTTTNLVFSTSPVLVTPTLGVASGTSLALTDGTDTYKTLVISDKWTLQNDAGTPANLATIDSTGKISIYGIATTDMTVNVASIYDGQAQASNSGSGITFVSKYTNVGDYTNSGFMRSLKDNGTNGNYGFGLVFGGRTHGEAMVEVMRIASSKNIGIMTVIPDRALEINSATGSNLRLTYNDPNGSATNYADLLTTASGDLTILPSGGDVGFYAGTGASLTDSSLVVNYSTGSPVLNWYGTDGDTWNIGISTADAATFNGATTYAFDNAITSGGNFALTDPGTSVNSYSISLKADNATTVQEGLIQVMYGADPYMRFSAPNDAGTATAILDLKDQRVVVGSSGAGVDYDIYFQGETNQGNITYMEDEDRFDFDNDVDVIADLTAGTVQSDATVKATTMVGNVAQQTITLGLGATTLAVTSNVITVTGDAGANTLATLTGATVGTYVFIFVDALVTITDTDAHTANTVDLAGTATNFTSADDKTLTLVYDGTSWYQIGTSTN